MQKCYAWFVAVIRHLEFANVQGESKALGHF